MADKMSLSEARNELAKFRKTFQAAQRLEEACVVAASAESELDKFESRRKKAEQTILALESDLDDHRKYCEDKKKELDENLENQKKQYNDAVRNLTLKYDADKQNYQKSVQSIKDAISNLDKEKELALAAHTQHLTKLSKEKKDAEEATAEAKRSLDDIRKRLGV